MNMCPFFNKEKTFLLKNHNLTFKDRWLYFQRRSRHVERFGNLEGTRN